MYPGGLELTVELISETGTFLLWHDCAVKIKIFDVLWYFCVFLSLLSPLQLKCSSEIEESTLLHEMM